MSDPSHSSFFLAGPTRIAFEKCLAREGLPSKNHSYFSYRANQFIKSANGRNPNDLSTEEIVAILGAFGRDENLADWQFGQLVEAVRILLLKCLTSQAAGQVDWTYWKASSRTVSGDHATTARDHSPIELVYLKVSRSDGEYSDIRRQHRDLIVCFATEIRARGYAYRTEEAYEQWIVVNDHLYGAIPGSP